MPGEAQWEKYAGDAAYLAILGGMSSGGIVLGKSGRLLVGEFSNSFVLRKDENPDEGRWLWTRTIGSTIVGELVDYGSVRDDRLALQGVPMEPVRDFID